MAKYEQVEFSKEKPKKSGWYRVSCVNGNPYSYTMRYYMSCAKSFADDGFGGAGTCDCLYWYRKLLKVRPTTGLTAVQALKAMQRGECVAPSKELAVFQVFKMDATGKMWGFVTPGRLNGGKWSNQCPIPVDDFNSETFSIVPDPSKEPEPEREVFGFPEALMKVSVGKSVQMTDYSPITFRCVNDLITNCGSFTVIDFSRAKFHEVQE